MGIYPCKNRRVKRQETPRCACVDKGVGRSKDRLSLNVGLNLTILNDGMNKLNVPEERLVGRSNKFEIPRSGGTFGEYV